MANKTLVSSYSLLPLVSPDFVPVFDLRVVGSSGGEEGKGGRCPTVPVSSSQSQSRLVIGSHFRKLPHYEPEESEAVSVS